jgi:hypothetical protein
MNQPIGSTTNFKVQQPRQTVTEKWKPIPGYEGFYSVSSLGRVQSDRYYKCSWPGKEIKPGLSPKYKRVTLTKNGSRKNASIHTLVCLAFIGPRPKGYVVNHKDSNKLNNELSNLEYVTASQNVHHAVLAGTHPQGKRHWHYKDGKRVGKQFLGMFVTKTRTKEMILKEKVVVS